MASERVGKGGGGGDGNRAGFQFPGGGGSGAPRHGASSRPLRTPMLR